MKIQVTAALASALLVAASCSGGADPGPLATTGDGGTGGQTGLDGSPGDTLDAGTDLDAGGGGDVGGGGAGGGTAEGDAGDGGGAEGGMDGGPVAARVGPGGDFKTYAARGATALHGYFNAAGLFTTAGWWNSANSMTTLLDFERVAGSTAYQGDLAKTFSQQSAQHFLNNFYDDEGWWALAWVRAYDLTRDAKYLAMAKTIFKDMAGGWDSTCNGGIWWSKDRKYKNAIANELFFLVAARLHDRTPNDKGPGSFDDWADREWTWFSASGMINASGLVNDGLQNCKNNGGTAWTYNQGVLVGALVERSAAKKDPVLLDAARSLADASIRTLVDDQGVLHENCEPTCGNDGNQFKGIFMRHLGELAAADPAPRYRAFLATNADWIWNAARGSGDHFGLSWSQLPDAADAIRQTSALDALVAAIPYSLPVTNLAKDKPATASGDCGAGQTALAATDGNVATKWCAGAVNGRYFLDVDLEAPTEIGRVVLRHAAAGGEKASWNTRAFTVSTSPDDKSFTVVANVQGSTRGVTIHSFAPVTARYVRLDITSPQSDPALVAARIAELEVYAR